MWGIGPAGAALSMLLLLIIDNALLLLSKTWTGLPGENICMRRRVAKETKSDAKAIIGRGNFPNILTEEGESLLSTFNRYYPCRLMLVVNSFPFVMATWHVMLKCLLYAVLHAVSPVPETRCHFAFCHLIYDLMGMAFAVVCFWCWKHIRWTVIGWESSLERK